MEAREVIDRLSQGHFLDDLEEALLTVGAEVLATQNQGKVTITLTLKHPQGADASLFTVEEKIALGMPKALPRGASFFLVDKQLHTRDPRQAAMDIRLLPDAKPEVRNVDDDGVIHEGAAS